MVKRVNLRYEEFGEAFLFVLRPIIESVPDNFRNEYKSRLIKKLNSYEFEKRKKIDPPHKESILVRGKIEFSFEDRNNPEHVAEAIKSLLNGYYVRDTMNNVRNYIVRNL